jgi:hypothetical protein
MSSPNPTPVASRAKLLTQKGLQDLRAQLFRIELGVLRQLIDNGIDPEQVALVADIARTIQAIEQLQLPARERS